MTDQQQRVMCEHRRLLAADILRQTDCHDNLPGRTRPA
jgi:hypothetical protein